MADPKEFSQSENRERTRRIPSWWPSRVKVGRDREDLLRDGMPNQKFRRPGRLEPLTIDLASEV